MTSKLFHAVVGFGISLGAATVGCLGAISDSPETTDAATTPTTPPTPNGSSSTSDPPPTSFDGAPVLDATLGDGGADTGRDAIVDAAFCDAAWPTTKGSPADPLPCVDPKGECAEAGWPIACYVATPAGTCDFSTSFATQCVGGQWQPCPNGSIKSEECK